MNKESIIEANTINWGNLSEEDVSKKVNELLRGYSIDDRLKAREHLLQLSRSAKVGEDDFKYLAAMEDIHCSKVFMGDEKKKVITITVVGTHLETVAEIDTFLSKMRKLIVDVSLSEFIRSKTQINL